jgi:hypothetical protein
MMDPRVVAASGDEVVVLWRQKGVDRTGERFDGPRSGSTASATENSPGRRCSTSIPSQS